MASDRKVKSTYNLTPIFWTYTLHSLQVTQFVTISRIFDKNKSAFSLHRLKKICKKNIGAFSNEALMIKRDWSDLEDYEIDDDVTDYYLKDLQVGSGPGWKKRYIENAYEMTRTDIDIIFNSLKDAESNHSRGAKTVRDDVFAHSNFENGDISKFSFDGVTIGEIERTLDDLHTVYFLINRNLWNGSSPDMVPRAYVPDRNIKKSVDLIIDKLLYSQP